MEEKRIKTQSQRLRASLWRLWEAEGKKGSAEEFYKDKMEDIIQWVIRKLPKNEEK